MIAPLLLLLAAAGAQDQADAPLSVPAQWHLVEGIASDGKRIWVSSVVDRTVLELAPGGGLRRKLLLPRSIGAPFGITWDARRQWLWIAAMCPAEPAIDTCGVSGLHAIDARGRLRRSLTIEGAFNPGDVSVDAEQGRVFVSDSLNGAIFSCSEDCTSLRPVIRPDERASAQGSVLSPDGASLIVADYSRGIVAVDLATGADRQVRTGDGKRLRGMDGLVRIGSTYVGIQNPGNPAELVAFRIGEDGALTDVRAVPTPVPLGEATQLVVSGDRLLLVADAQWRLYAGKDAAGPAAQQATPILSMPLSDIAR